ncbi:2-hydroxychromene-2-carboxylate isomerase [Rhodoplanes sp. TEM]|uniref:2-hydroxychromene-2-carboxylate isomerase n=1 Tax=Rhodoplanes tepidamans TaxID=200616 RepID=A0ABT5JGF5_RHOTP|nr:MULTISPECIES: 2-hydroxychromene-2-carboxylate isomerase [Rhodoplanes]MDC7788421.1 2-hydroxychromene-2-carboxylate isomerase [Rhodoplanes tepidamans]MDC7983566.1 2-hydroxychromene-2-carboxylate isomerase [Rhodoplanes sp. TEM]MDQ0354191.1 2-hydroxychromene-2-carboxylate isomerase [Rhodoplanes tepidamans]
MTEAGIGAGDDRRPALDVWFEFASTYSYPALVRIGPLARAAAVRLRFRPFLLGPIFKRQGWDTSPFVIYPAKGRYMWRDLERICVDLGLPLRRPPVFPASSVLAARVALVGLDVAAGAAGEGAGWGEAFCVAVFRACLGEGRAIDDPAVIADLLSGLGVPPEPVLAQAATPAAKARLREETEEAERIGVFGAPSFVTADGELFWGNDRLEQALAWATRRA